MRHEPQAENMPMVWLCKGEKVMVLSLAEFESRCLGNIPGEVTPADVVHAINRVSALGDAYSERLMAKASAWRAKPRRRQQQTKPVRGIEHSLPAGDR